MSLKRRGLGRGLDALLEVEDAAPSTTVSVDKIRPNRFQPRTHFESSALAELAASIKSQGIVQPILVTPGDSDGEYVIIAGERRWRAAKQAGLREVPVVVREVTSDREMFEMALVENLQRSDLNPVEEAEAYKRLLGEFGLKQEDVAARVGKSRSTVTNALRLLNLPAEIQDFLRDGTLTAGQVRPLLSLPSPDDQIRWARKATQDKLTAREMEKAVTKTASKRARGRKRPDADTAAAEETLTKIFQSKVEIRRRRRGGTLSIAFHSEDELIRLYDLLVRAGEKR
jgi:ParB family chromosome partitioning protein